MLVHGPSILTVLAYGTGQPSQARLSSAGLRLGFLQIRGLVTKDSSQQLPTRVLWDSINELDATSQLLVRDFMIRNVLRIRISQSLRNHSA